MYLLFVKEFFEEHLPVVVTADDTEIIDDNYLRFYERNKI